MNCAACKGHFNLLRAFPYFFCFSASAVLLSGAWRLKCLGYENVLLECPVDAGVGGWLCSSCESGGTSR
ncbi:hypothetical protein SBV1_2980005 [Verrucomicrobia bacterium]|nr:hypothetical protein SBV1_2980005 [Verrucomicrobiota bacterium]